MGLKYWRPYLNPYYFDPVFKIIAIEQHESFQVQICGSDNIIDYGEGKFYWQCKNCR